MCVSESQKPAWRFGWDLGVEVLEHGQSLVRSAGAWIGLVVRRSHGVAGNGIRTGEGLDDGMVVRENLGGGICGWVITSNGGLATGGLAARRGCTQA